MLFLCPRQQVNNFASLFEGLVDQGLLPGSDVYTVYGQRCILYIVLVNVAYY